MFAAVDAASEFRRYSKHCQGLDHECVKKSIRRGIADRYRLQKIEGQLKEFRHRFAFRQHLVKVFNKGRCRHEAVYVLANRVKALAYRSRIDAVCFSSLEDVIFRISKRTKRQRRLAAGFLVDGSPCGKLAVLLREYDDHASVVRDLPLS